MAFRLQAALVLLCFVATIVSAEDIVEQWNRSEFVQVPGGVCPVGNWPATSEKCAGSVLYGCLPSWSGLIDFVDGTPENCTLDRVVVTASGSFGCPSEPYTVTATLNDETVVGELQVDPTELNCGCTDGSDSIVVADFDPSEVEGFQFNGQNLVTLSANDEFCACMTQVVGTFRCDLEQEEHVLYVEQQVLEQIYHLGNGENWYNSSGWLEGTPCENEWYGISCDELGHVVAISLSSNNLNGILPDLSPISSLVALEVMNNRLFGSLPELPRSISEVFFSVNNFQGSIPDSWDTLKQIEFMNVDDNYLTGSIPQSLMYGLVDVVQFSVSSNFFNGTFPSDLSRNLRLLELTLSFNEFSGSLPRQYPDVEASHLQYVSFDHNLFSGPLPVDVDSKVPLLAMFTVEQNDLTGTLPAEFASLQRLLRMDIRDNQLSGVLPDAYNDRPDIHVLAGGNDWTCPLPEWCDRGVSTCGLCEGPADSSSTGSSSGATSSAHSDSGSSSTDESSEGISSDDDSNSAQSTGSSGDSSAHSADSDVGLVPASNSSSIGATSDAVLSTDDVIVVIVAGIIFSCCGLAIVVGIFLYVIKKKRTGELELPSFVDNDE